MKIGYIRSLKYHLVVMLSARIDVIQPQIGNLITTCCHCQTRKTTTAVVKWRKMSRLDRNDRQTWSHLQHTLLIWKGSIKCGLLLLWVHLKIYCISWLYCVWNNVCVHVSKTNWRFIIICNFIYIVVINCGWRIDGSARYGDWRWWLSSSDVIFLRKSQGLVKKHS